MKFIQKLFGNNKLLATQEAQEVIKMLDQGIITMIDLEKGVPVLSMGFNSRSGYVCTISTQSKVLRIVGSVDDIANGSLSGTQGIPEQVLVYHWNNQVLLEVAQALKEKKDTYAVVVRGFGWRAQWHEWFSGYRTILIYRR